MTPLERHEPPCEALQNCLACGPGDAEVERQATWKPRLSATQLSMLARCGLQYDFRYVQGIKSPPGVSLIIGKGTHGAIEKDLGSKMEWGELLPDDAIADHAADATRREWEREPPQLHDDDPNIGGAIDTAVSLAQLHHKQVAPKIEPVALERGFVLELPDFPFDITGYVDVEEEATIRDTKTASKAPPANAADISDQLTIYHLDATVRGATGKAVALDYLVKKNRPEAITLRSTRGPMDHVRFLRRVEAAARVIKSGAFLPTAPDNWCCSSKWCGYWERCPHGSRKTVSVGFIDPSRLTSRVAERRP